MKNVTSRVGGTGCRAHVPSAPGVSCWKGTSCQRQLRGGSGTRALSECSCALDNVLTAGPRHGHRPSLILILALLGRLGHSRIIPSSPPKRGAGSRFPCQDTQPLSWVMDICEGSAAYQPLNPLNGGSAEGAPVPTAPSSRNSQGIDGEAQDRARLDRRISPGLKDTCHPPEEAEKWLGNSRSISLLL